MKRKSTKSNHLNEKVDKFLDEWLSGYVEYRNERIRYTNEVLKDYIEKSFYELIYTSEYRDLNEDDEFINLIYEKGIKKIMELKKEERW